MSLQSSQLLESLVSTLGNCVLDIINSFVFIKTIFEFFLELFVELIGALLHLGHM
jgi:hypothetical protein